MALSAKKIGWQTLLLIRYVILKFGRDKKKKWWEKWDKSELLSEGYSDLIVAKARQYDFDLTLTSMSPVWLCIMYIIWMSTFRDTNEQVKWFGGGILVLGWLYYLGWGIYRQHRYNKAKLSHADNLLVLNELTAKLGADILERAKAEEHQEHPLLESWNRRLEKRAILWRLDRFLSRKPMTD